MHLRGGGSEPTVVCERQKKSREVRDEGKEGEARRGTMENTSKRRRDTKNKEIELWRGRNNRC